MTTLSWTAPEVKESINRLVFSWPSLDLKVIADRITDAGIAELWFYHCNTSGESLLHTAKANLMASATMTSLAKRMTQHSKDVPWTQVITCITKEVMEYARRGESGVIIKPVPGKAVHPGYYVKPLTVKGVPNIIFGDKGVNKTTIGLTALGIAALGVTDSHLGFQCAQPAKVALLDWESNQNLTNYTLARLIEGKTIPWYSLPYLRCKQPLADDIDRIANFLHDNQTELVLIDSLGQAAGSDKFDTAGKRVALMFFEALRQLNLTSLIIAQNAKGEEGKKTIYGSTYFTYYSRNIFELKGKQDELDENQMHVALFHQESNYSKRYQPMGFNLQYTDSSISITPEDVSLSAFLERASQTKALCEFLKEGAKSLASIQTEIGLSINKTRSLLSKSERKGIIISLGSGMWGLAREGDEL